MLHKIKKTILLLLTVMISQNICAAYLVSELGRLPGYAGDKSSAALVDLNNSGEIAGTVFRYVDFWFRGLVFNEHDFRAFYASESKGIIDIGDLGGNVAAALSINKAGKVAGWSTTTGPYSSFFYGNFWNPKGFVWDSSGITPVEHSYILDIDNNDNIVTNDSIYHPALPDSPQIHKRNDMDQGIDHGFGAENSLWGFPTHLRHYPYDDSTRQEINCISDNMNGYGCTASFHNGTQWLDIGTLGGSWSTAYNLNNSGQVVGASTINDVDNPGSDGQIRAYLWHNNVIKDLIAEATALPADASDIALLQNGDTRAISINNSGQVLIQAYPTSLRFRSILSQTVDTYRYYIWENDVISKIDTVWPESFGSRHLHLSAINDQGQLAGFGSPDSYWDYASEWHVVLLTPETNTTDLALSVSGEADGLINQTFNVNFLIDNIGSNPAIPQLTVSIPESLSTDSLPDSCTRETSVITCLFSELGKSESKSLVFNLSGSQPGIYKIHATVASTTNSDPVKSNNIVHVPVNLSDADPSLQISFPQDNTIIGRDPSGTGSFQLNYNAKYLDISEGNNLVKISVDGNVHSTVTSNPITINNLNDGEHRIEVEAVNSADESLGISDTIHIHVAKETVIEVGNSRHLFGWNLYTHDLDIKGDFFVAAGTILDPETPSGQRSVIYFYHYQNSEWQKILPLEENVHSNFEGWGGVASNGGLTPLANIVDSDGSGFVRTFTGVHRLPSSIIGGPFLGMPYWFDLISDSSKNFGIVGYSLDIEGYHSFVLGEPDHDFNNIGMHSGGVRIAPNQMLSASDLGAGDLLGFSVAIENGLVVAGAIGDDENGSFSGAAYVYDLNFDLSSPKKLLAEDGAAFDRFGHGVDISNQTIAVGAPLNDEAGNNMGAIYLFDKVDDQWRQSHKLIPTDYTEAPSNILDQSGSGTTFGNVVQVDGDIIITAGAKTDHPRYDAGEVHFFRRTDEDGWGQSRKIISTLPSSSTSSYMFGYDVSINGNFLGVKTNSNVHIFELSDIDYATDLSMSYRELELVSDSFVSPVYYDQPYTRLLGQLDLVNFGPKQPSSEVVFTFPNPVIISQHPQCQINPELQNQVICFTGDIIRTEMNQFKFWIFKDHVPEWSQEIYDDIVNIMPASEGDTFANVDIHAAIRSRWPDPDTGNNKVTIRFPSTDFPVARDDNYFLSEGEDYISTVSVLNNDSDPLSRSLTIETIPVQAPLYGDLTINSDGTFQYQHDGSEFVQDSFKYQISNSIDTATATVSLNMTAVNDSPMVINDQYDVDEGATLDVAAPGIMANDSDVDDDNLSVSLTEQALHGIVTLMPDGQFTYAHDGSEQAIDQFTYTLSDGKNTVVGTVVLNITNVNSLPIVEDVEFQIEKAGTLDIAAPGLLENTHDDNGDSLMLETTAVIEPSYGTVTLYNDGAFTYQHNGSQVDSDSFVFRVTDGKSTVDATVTITILHSNEAPLANPDDYVLNEGSTLTVEVPGLLKNDTDADSDQLIVTTTPEVAPSHGVLTLGADGSFSYTHDGSESREDSFIYTMSDGSAVSKAMVSLAIQNINDTPVAESDHYEINIGGLLNVIAPGLLENDSDDDNDTLLVSENIHKVPQHGTVEIHTNGSFIYQHDGSQNTSDLFEYSVHDQHSESTGIVNITIFSNNAPPIATDQSFETLEDTAIENQQLEASDIENDPLLFSVTMMPNKGTLSLTSNGLFSYQPLADENGEDQFKFTVNDGHQDSETETTVTIHIVAQNDAPKASHQRLLVQQQDPSSHQLKVTDIDSDNFNFYIVDEPEKGEIILNEDTGEFEYTSDTDQYGPDSFSYQASDGEDISNIATVNIIINSRGNNKPTKPKLLSPEPDSIGHSTNVEFIWENSEDKDGDQLSYSLLICSNEDFVDCEAEAIRKIDVASLLPLTGVSIVLLGLTGSLHRRRWLLFAAITVVIVLNGCESQSLPSANIKIDLNNKTVDLRHTVNDLQAGTQYYWKIIVEDIQGGVSESETRMFVTAD